MDTFSCFVFSSMLSGCHDSITVATVGELCYVMYMYLPSVMLGILHITPPHSYHHTHITLTSTPSHSHTTPPHPHHTHITHLHTITLTHHTHTITPTSLTFTPSHSHTTPPHPHHHAHITLTLLSRHIFCNDCTSKTANVPTYKKPERVCESCYTELNIRK